MQVKTSDLIGPALDWAVAKCGGKGIEFDDPRDPWLTVNGIADQPLHSYTPSSDWSQGGPIIERERLWIQPEIGKDGAGNAWYCVAMSPHDAYGPTPLIAAMRCYVAIKMGNTVEIPGGLLP
jgi:hypothetical protein